VLHRLPPHVWEHRGADALAKIHDDISKRFSDCFKEDDNGSHRG